MLKINTPEIKNILEKYDLFNVQNKKNFQIISNLFRETYQWILSDDEIEYFLIKSIKELDVYNNYSFFDKKNNKIDLINVLIETKEYNNEYFSGILHNYRDLTDLNIFLRHLKVFDVNNEEIRGSRQKQIVALELSKIGQKNLFLQLFRSLFIEGKTWLITWVFNLRFFNKQEIYRLANVENSEFWKVVLDSIENEPVSNYFTEKVDWQLFLLYTVNNITLLQSKSSIISLDELKEIWNNKGGIFTEMKNFYQNQLNVSLDFLDQIAKKYDYIYQFEFLKNTNPIVQEYNPNSVWLYLLWARFKHGFFSVINMLSFEDYNFDYNNLYNSLYWPLYELYGENINTPEDLLIHKIEMSDDFFDIERKIKEKRKSENVNIEDYIIEWIIENFNYLKMKVKSWKYFLAKIFKSFTEKRIIREMKYINNILFNLKTKEKFLRILDKMWERIKEENLSEMDLDYLNKKIFNKFQNIKLAKFLTYRNKYYSLDENYYLYESIEKDPEYFIEQYKEYLFYYFLTEITKALLSDSEEISELHEILNINTNINLESETVISDLRNYLLELVESWNYDKNNSFLNKISEIKDFIIIS